MSSLAVSISRNWIKHWETGCLRKMPQSFPEQSVMLPASSECLCVISIGDAKQNRSVPVIGALRVVRWASCFLTISQSFMSSIRDVPSHLRFKQPYPRVLMILFSFSVSDCKYLARNKGNQAWNLLRIQLHGDLHLCSWGIFESIAGEGCVGSDAAVRNWGSQRYMDEDCWLGQELE